MRRRRAMPRSTGRTGRTSVPAHSGLRQAFDDSDYPIDDLPPDDLPVRDLTADLDEPHSAHVDSISADDQGGRDPADPAYGLEARSAEPNDPRSNADHGPFKADLQHERAGERSTLDLHPKAGAEEAHTQYSLPGLGLENAVETQLDPGKTTSKRPRQPCGLSKRKLKPTQIELWPDG
jgi:hypothetical protein